MISVPDLFNFELYGLIKCDTSAVFSILNNRVVLYSPLQNSAVSFRVGEIAFAILSELKKEEDASSYRLSLKGSSVTNACVASIYPVCNDIDLEIEYMTDAQDKHDSYVKIDAILKRSFQALLRGSDENDSWEVFGVKEAPFTFLNPHHSFSLYKLEPNPFDCSLPLDIPVHFVSNSDVTRHANNGDSFYIPLEIFNDLFLGSCAKDEYVLFSREGDCKLAVQQVLQGEITSRTADTVDKFGWYRYLMAVTEWGTSKNAKLNELLYKNNASLAQSIVPQINRFINGKRPFSEYPLFLYINALFHAPEGSVVQASLIEHVHFLICQSCKGNSPWIDFLSEIFKTECPVSLTPILLKLLIPLLAEEVFIVEHLGQTQMRCKFDCEGRSFYVQIPLFNQSDIVQAQEIVGFLSNTSPLLEIYSLNTLPVFSENELLKSLAQSDHALSKAIAKYWLGNREKEILPSSISQIENEILLKEELGILQKHGLDLLEQITQEGNTSLLSTLFLRLMPFYSKEEWSQIVCKGIEAFLKKNQNSLEAFSTQDWMNLQSLLLSASETCLESWKALFIWLIIRLSPNKTSAPKAFLEVLWGFTNKIPLSKCSECFPHESYRFAYSLNTFALIHDIDPFNAHSQLERALKYPLTVENQMFFKQLMPADFSIFNQTFDDFLQKGEHEKALLLLTYQGNAFGYEGILDLYERFPDSKEIDETIVSIVNPLKDLGKAYFFFRKRSDVARFIEKQESFLQTIQELKEAPHRDIIFFRIGELAREKDFDHAIFLLRFLPKIQSTDFEIQTSLKSLLQNMEGYPKKQEILFDFIEVEYPHLAREIIQGLFKEKDIFPIGTSVIKLFKQRLSLEEELSWLLYLATHVKSNVEKNRLVERFSPLMKSVMQYPPTHLGKWEFPSLLLKILPYYSDTVRLNVLKDFIVWIRGNHQEITSPMWDELSIFLERSSLLIPQKNPWKLLFNDLISTNSFTHPFLVVLSEKTKHLPLTLFPKVFSDKEKEIKHYADAIHCLYPINPAEAAFYLIRVLETIDSKETRLLAEKYVTTPVDVTIVFQQFLQEKKRPLEIVAFLQGYGCLFEYLPTIPLYLKIQGREASVLEILDKDLKEESKEQLLVSIYSSFHAFSPVLDVIEKEFFCVNKKYMNECFIRNIKPSVWMSRTQKAIDQKEHQVAEMLFYGLSLLKIKESEKIEFFQICLKTFKEDTEKRDLLLRLMHVFFKDLARELFVVDPLVDPLLKYAFLLHLLQIDFNAVSSEAKKEFGVLVLEEIKNRINEPKSGSSLVSKAKEALMFMSDQDRLEVAIKCVGRSRKVFGTANSLFKMAIASIQDLQQAIQNHSLDSHILEGWMQFLNSSANDFPEKEKILILTAKKQMQGPEQVSESFLSTWLSFFFRSREKINDFEVYSAFLEESLRYMSLESQEKALVSEIFNVLNLNKSEKTCSELAISLAYLCAKELASIEDLSWVIEGIGEFIEDPKFQLYAQEIIEKQFESYYVFLNFLIRKDIVVDNPRKEEFLKSCLLSFKFSKLYANEEKQELLNRVIDYVIPMYLEHKSHGLFDSLELLVDLSIKLGQIGSTLHILKQIDAEETIDELINSELILAITRKNLSSVFKKDLNVHLFFLNIAKKYLDKNAKNPAQDCLRPILKIAQELAPKEASKEIDLLRLEVSVACIEQLNTFTDIFDISWVTSKIVQNMNEKRFADLSKKISLIKPSKALEFVALLYKKSIEDPDDLSVLDLLNSHLESLAQSKVCTKEWIPILRILSKSFINMYGKQQNQKVMFECSKHLSVISTQLEQQDTFDRILQGIHLDYLKKIDIFSGEISQYIDYINKNDVLRYSLQSSDHTSALLMWIFRYLSMIRSDIKLDNDSVDQIFSILIKMASIHLSENDFEVFFNSLLLCLKEKKERANSYPKEIVDQTFYKITLMDINNSIITKHSEDICEHSPSTAILFIQNLYLKMNAEIDGENILEDLRYYMNVITNKLDKKDAQVLIPFLDGLIEYIIAMSRRFPEEDAISNCSEALISLCIYLDEYKTMVYRLLSEIHKPRLKGFVNGRKGTTVLTDFSAYMWYLESLMNTLSPEDQASNQELLELDFLRDVLKLSSRLSVQDKERLKWFFIDFSNNCLEKRNTPFISKVVFLRLEHTFERMHEELTNPSLGFLLDQAYNLLNVLSEFPMSFSEATSFLNFLMEYMGMEIKEWSSDVLEKKKSRFDTMQYSRILQITSSIFLKVQLDTLSVKEKSVFLEGVCNQLTCMCQSSSDYFPKSSCKISKKDFCELLHLIIKYEDESVFVNWIAKLISKGILSPLLLKDLQEEIRDCGNNAKLSAMSNLLDLIKGS